MASLPPSDWMASLDGRRDVSQLTIPGTHDSTALRGGLRARTQTMDVLAQLHAGIRFFDIRLRDDAGVFRLYHGSVDQGAELETGVVDPMVGFLARHPGETVIMSVKQEDEGDAARFARDFENLVARRAASFHVSPVFPRLADGRGRIVLFRRFSGSAIGIPAPPERWQNDATFQIRMPGGPLTVEDRWEVAGPLPWQIDDKWDAVARNLDAAANSPTGGYITFTSGTSDFIHPRAIAAGIPFVAGINQRLLDHLAVRRVRQRLGTIVMDFPELPDRRLIQSLVDANLRSGAVVEASHRHPTRRPAG